MINLIYVLILALAFPIGYLLAWVTRDELIVGRKWFIFLSIVSILSVIPVSILIKEKLPSILTLFFLSILCLIAIWKSYDKKWVR
jgi:hypothetical protein